MRQFEREKKTTRDAFGSAVYDLAKTDSTIIGLGADTTSNLGMKTMAQEFPDRVINIGIAEQNMLGVAAGLAANGYHVFAGSFAPFVAMRSLEQFRTFIAYPHLNVKLAGGMGGMSAGNEGVTHQCPEDMAIMRVIPDNVVVFPADTASTDVIVKELAKHNGPAYIRLGKLPFLKVFDEDYTFTIGKGNQLEEGTDATIFCYGSTVSRSLQVYDRLKEKGISVRVVEMPCIKPLDEEAVLKAALETGCIITVEDSTIVGALGSAVAEYLGEHATVPMKRVGVPDCFTESGDYELLMDKYGLSLDDIETAVEETIARKV